MCELPSTGARSGRNEGSFSHRVDVRISRLSSLRKRLAGMASVVISDLSTSTSPMSRERLELTFWNGA